jgi:hypothetical protein
MYTNDKLLKLYQELIKAPYEPSIGMLINHLHALSLEDTPNRFTESNCIEIYRNLIYVQEAHEGLVKFLIALFDEEINELLLSDILTIVKTTKKGVVLLHYAVHCAKILLKAGKYPDAFRLASKCYRFEMYGADPLLAEGSLEILIHSKAHVALKLGDKKVGKLLACLKGLKYSKMIAHREIELCGKLLDNMNFEQNVMSSLNLLKGTIITDMYCFDLKKSALVYMTKAFKNTEKYAYTMLIDLKICDILFNLAPIQFLPLFPTLIEYCNLFVKTEGTLARYSLVNSRIVLLLIALIEHVPQGYKSIAPQLILNVLEIVEAIYVSEPDRVRKWIIDNKVCKLIGSLEEGPGKEVIIVLNKYMDKLEIYTFLYNK